MRIVLDLETQFLAEEVGGWRHVDRLLVAVACTWDEDNGPRTWWEDDIGDLVGELDRASEVVGFNLEVFDYKVLSHYGLQDTGDLRRRTFDLLAEIRAAGSRPVGLDMLALTNLGEGKSAGGIEAVWMWRGGYREELAAKCHQDVDFTRRLVDLWEEAGLLWVGPGKSVQWPGDRVGLDDEALAEKRRALYKAHHGRRG